MKPTRVSLAALCLAVACEVPLVVRTEPDELGAAGATSGVEAGGRGMAGSESQAGAEAGGAGSVPVLNECERPLVAWSVSAGESHACATEYLGGAMYCWGLGTSGQLGTGKLESATIPSLVETNEMFSEIGVGALSTCARSAANGLFCFGDNAGGMLADGTDEDQAVPIVTAETAMYFATGGSHVVARTATGLLAWGDDTNGQLGLGDASVGTVVRTETNVAAIADFVALTAGPTHVCAIDLLAFHGYCTGSNELSRLGLPGGQRSEFTEVLSQPLRRISAGYDRTCAVTKLDDLECWGNNEPVTFLGEPTVLPRPKRIGKRMDWLEISVGYDHICGATLDGKLLCAGDNSHGELGIAGPAQPDFVEPLPGTSFSHISAGRDFTCALREPDRAVVCFGSNEHGKLGRWTDSQVSHSPELVCLPPP